MLIVKPHQSPDGKWSYTLDDEVTGAVATSKGSWPTELEAEARGHHLLNARVLDLIQTGDLQREELDSARRLIGSLKAGVQLMFLGGAVFGFLIAYAVWGI